MKFYTIGYGGKKPEALVKVLTANGITLVCDIRKNPRGYLSWYTYYPNNPDSGIVKLLRDAGIKYHWEEELGNPNPKGTLEAFRHYFEPQAEARLQTLVTISETFCLMCAEKDYNRCHRKVIAESLERLGHEVVHL